MYGGSGLLIRNNNMLMSAVKGFILMTHSRSFGCPFVGFHFLCCLFNFN